MPAKDINDDQGYEQIEPVISVCFNASHLRDVLLGQAKRPLQVAQVGEFA